MRRLKLLSLQILVMLVFLGVWHVVTTTSLFGDVKTMQFFFSTPGAVLARTFKQLTSADIYYHLGITLTETVLAFVIGSVAGILFGFAFARRELLSACLLYTSDAADEEDSVDLGGRRIIKKIFFKQKTAYEIGVRLVGSEMCIRDRAQVDDADSLQRCTHRRLLTRTRRCR